MFPRVDQQQVVNLLRERRFIVIEGPPGTGKTRLARTILREDFGGHGMSIQFHPAVTYEQFVAGISPAVTADALRFMVAPGVLVQAIRHAREGPFLLHVDEINRADLGRVLGEAIYLFEPREIAGGTGISVRLPQPLDDGTTEISIPKHLFVLGTMNSADRSIAILDMAVRRRFAFVSLWPDFEVVAAQGIDAATEAFARLQAIFVQYAPDDALPLLPGHSYFLSGNEAELARRLRYELLPLLGEYLQEGRLGGCEHELRAYIDWLEGEIIANASPS
jgi:5-methylcytosine-specific restriction protein B